MDINMIRNMDPGQLTLLGSAVSVMITLHFTLQLLSQHLFYWKNPKEQKAILIIIMMAPLYAIDSFVGLLDIQGSKAFFMLLDSIKECYEALGIVLDILVAMGIVRSHHFWLDVEHIEEAIQNVLVCLEMVVFSVLMHTMFHPTVETLNPK